MSKKTCQNCHYLKTLKKDLQKSYDNFLQLAESKSSMEDGYQSQIEELNKEVEYLTDINKKQSERIYRLTCENESLNNQLSSRPGLPTVQRYKEDMINAVREKSVWVQKAASETIKRANLEKKIKELEAYKDLLKDVMHNSDSELADLICQEMTRIEKSNVK